MIPIHRLRFRTALLFFAVLALVLLHAISPDARVSGAQGGVTTNAAPVTPGEAGPVVPSAATVTDQNLMVIHAALIPVPFTVNIPIVQK